jgi:hypothetical protein
VWCTHTDFQLCLSAPIPLRPFSLSVSGVPGHPQLWRAGSFGLSDHWCPAARQGLGSPSFPEEMATKAGLRVGEGARGGWGAGGPSHCSYWGSETAKLP